MNKAVSRSLFALFMLLVAPVETFADSRHSFMYDSEVTQRVQESLRSGESLKISQWLRLSDSEARELVGLKLRVRNQNGSSSSLSLLAQGRVLETTQVRSSYSEEITFHLSSEIHLETLRLICHGEVMVESISGVLRNYQDYGSTYLRQPEPEEMIQLHLNKVVRGGTRFQLSHMTQEMQGLTLEGAEIERIILIGRAESRTRTSASAQVLMDGRPVSGHELVNTYSDKTPIRILSSQSVTHSLELLVQGEMIVDAVLIKVGRVQRIRSSHESLIPIREILERGQTLSLAPFSRRSPPGVDRFTLQVTSLERYGEIQILNSWGEIIMTETLRSGSSRVEIVLPRNTELREVSLRSWSRVMVESIEFEENTHHPSRRY